MKSKYFKIFWRGVSVFLITILITFPVDTTIVRAAAGDVIRVSVDSSGAQANGWSRRTTISGDGRYVVFESDAGNLVSGDTNGAGDIFLHDRQTGAIKRISVNSSGAEANGGSDSPFISNDGRYVAFYSSASSLVSGDTNGVGDIFVHDRQTGLTTRVSVDSSGNQANGESSEYELAISGDGRYVAFPSEATNLVSGDTNDAGDIFVHDRQTSQTRRVSIALNGAEANGGSGEVDISEDGRYITFSSSATNLVVGDTNGKRDIFVYDLQTGAATRVSINTSGEQADGGGGSPAISGDGRYVVFLSDSGNLSLGANDYRGKALVYVHDRQIGQTTLASVYSDGSTMTVGLFDQPTISRDGRYVAFSFYDKGDNNGIMNIWVRDLQTGESIRATDGNASSYGPSLSADGKIVAFWSMASNLVSGDTNGAPDIFVREIANGPDRNPTVVSVTPKCWSYASLCPYPTPSSVSFIVIFSEQVTGVSVDDFSLETSAGITAASITGISGYGVEYLVTVDTGTGEGTLRLNVLDDDSIKDTTLNPLGGIGSGNGNFTNGKMYRIDKSSPTVTSIMRADSNPTSAAEVRFTVSFTEGVYPVKLSGFVLSTTGSISGASVTAISPREDEYRTEATYTVTVNTGTGEGTLRLDLIDDDSILDVINNPLGGPGAGNGNFTSGETYAIDRIPPAVLSIQRLDPQPTAAEAVHFIVTFSEPVSGVDGSDFSLTTSGVSGAAMTENFMSGNTCSVTVNTGTGNGTIRLDVLDNDSIIDSTGNPLGGVGAGNGSFNIGETYTINKVTYIPLSEKYKSNGTNDGWVLESNESSNKGGSKNSAAATFNLGDDARNRQYRAILHFPTFSLPDDAVVTKVILMIKAQKFVGVDPFTTHGNISIDIRYGPFGSFGPIGIKALQISDFQAPSSLNSVGLIQNNPVGGWYWAMLDSSAFPYINLIGVTQFRLAFQLDDNNDRGDDYIKFYSGDQTDQRDRPQLLIEYYVLR
jgi:Tol biopolymer transport system component